MVAGALAGLPSRLLGGWYPGRLDGSPGVRDVDGGGVSGSVFAMAVFAAMMSASVRLLEAFDAALLGQAPPLLLLLAGAAPELGASCWDGGGGDGSGDSTRTGTAALAPMVAKAQRAVVRSPVVSERMWGPSSACAACRGQVE